MMQDWKENVFNRSTFGDLQFYYSGIREKSMNHHYGPRMAKHYLLNFVCEGSADFWCQGVRQEIYPGTFYVMFPNEDMYYQTKKDMGWSIYWVVVDGYQVELLLSELGLTPDNPFLKIENAENLKELFNQIFELTKEDSFKNKMLCHSCLYQIFAILLEQKREIGHKNLIWEAERYISQHLSGTVTVNEIAAHVHLNGNYFTKLLTWCQNQRIRERIFSAWARVMAALGLSFPLLPLITLWATMIFRCCAAQSGTLAASVKSDSSTPA
jgi:hypothetical protein